MAVQWPGTQRQGVRVESLCYCGGCYCCRVWVLMRNVYQYVAVGCCCFILVLRKTKPLRPDRYLRRTLESSIDSTE